MPALYRYKPFVQLFDQLEDLGIHRIGAVQVLDHLESRHWW